MPRKSSTSSLTYVDTSWKRYFRVQKEFFVVFTPFLYLQGIECISYVFTTYFAGLIDETHLAGVGLGCTVSNFLMVSAMYGYSSVYETFGPPIYSSPNRKNLGVLLMRCVIQGLVVFLFVLGPYVNFAQLLQYISKVGPVDKSTSQTVQDVAQRFILYSCGFGYVDYCVDLLNKYLITQERYLVTYVTSTVYVVVYVLANYLLVSVMEYRVAGLVAAMYTARGTNLLLQIIYCFCCHLKGDLAWSGFSFKMLDGWAEMMKLGLSAILSLLADIGIVEISTFLIQLSGTVNLSVLVIYEQVHILITAIVLAHGYATALLLGYELGRADPKNARMVSNVGILNAVMISSLICLILWLARYKIVMLFTTNNDVIEMFGRIIWIAFLYICVDYIQSIVFWGVLAVFGKQRYKAAVSIVVGYLIGIPSAFYIVLKTNLGAKGVFVLFLGVSSLKLILFSIRMWFININREMEATKVRVDEFHSVDVDYGKRDYQLLRKSDDEQADCDTTIKVAGSPVGSMYNASNMKKLRKVTMLIFLATLSAASSFLML